MIELAPQAIAAVINTNLPGPYSVSSTGPVAIIGNAYYFALALGGLLAFGSIVYAGITWASSQGNPSKISDAKDQITQALLGLLLLFGAYIILNTINPALTVLNIPALSEIKTQSTAPKETCGYPDPATSGTCFSGRICTQDSVTKNYSCIFTSYIYCGGKLPDGSISAKCPISGDICGGPPDYKCDKPSKQYYACVKAGDPSVVICNTGGSSVATPETLDQCTTRCKNVSGTTCAVRPDICNP